MKTGKIDLKSLTRGEIEAFLGGMGLPRYRADQVVHWIYDRFVTDIDRITEFSGDLRSVLSERAYISSLKVVGRMTSSDGTEKFLFSLEDGYTVESVLIPDDDRMTLCISSQVGCAMGCRFCLTGSGGFGRNLRAHEIVDQVLVVNSMISGNMPGYALGEKMDEGQIFGTKITNIVLMGMGEPLMNFDNVVEALWRMVGIMGLSKRRITLSTAGVASKLPLLSEKSPGVNLAVSLNAATDEVRDRIMPINRKYPLRSLIQACRDYPLPAGRRLTFEYVLIDGVNDSPSDAKRLVHLLKGLRCKINLIPFNPHEGSCLKRSPDEKIQAFQKMLLHLNRRALIRESRGQDILAACGQLRSRNGADSADPGPESEPIR